MKKMLFFILCVSCVCLAATTVNIPVSADADIREATADTAYGARTENIASTIAGNSSKVYMRFALPSDFGTATSAKLRVVRTSVGSATVNLYYSLYGLNDGAAGQDWLETTAYVSDPATVQNGLTWNNAPANAALNAFTTDAASLSQIMLPKGDDGGVVGSVHEFTGQQIANCINNDTDGVVTFMISCDNTTSAFNSFAGKENTTYDEPILELTYEPLETVTISLNAVADTDIRYIAPDYAKANRAGIWVSSVTNNAIKGYARFELPTDIGTVLSATITYHRTVNAGAWNSTYDVYGLNNNVLGNDWPELSPGAIPGKDYTFGLTWNNAPGNDTASFVAFDLEKSTMLGAFQVLGTTYGGVKGDSYSVSTAAVKNFLNDDTDGAVTFMISRHFGESTSLDVFGAKETGAPATLSITYVPSCGVRLLADVNHDCVVDFADFAQVGASWLGNDPNFFVAAEDDIYPNGTIGIDDLDMMAESWLNCSRQFDIDCDQYWKGQYLAVKRYNNWRRSFDTFPIAAWAYFARYTGDLAEYQLYEQAGLTMVQTIPAQYQNAVDAGLYTIMGTWDALYANLAKVDTFMDTPTPIEPSLRGLYLRDDIRDYQIPLLVDANQKILLEDVRGAIPMATVLPPWGSLSGSGGASPYEDWVAYVDEYVNTVHPALLSNAFYSLLSDKNEREGTYDNLEFMRAKALENGIGFAAFAIVNQHLGYRAPSESDLNWKMWANLAYGAKAIWYYNWRIEPINDFSEGIVTHLDGEPTPVYALVQAINTDIKAMGAILMSFESTGVYHADVADPNNTTIALYQDGDLDAIATFTGSQFVIGEFENVDDAADTADYVMIVNKRHGADKLSSELDASLSFAASAGVTAVDYFNTSTSAWQPLTQTAGTYQATLGGGKSILIRFNY